MKKKTTQKGVPYLDYECKIGERVCWKNIQSEYFEGILTSWDDNLATVQLSDGSEQTIKC